LELTLLFKDLGIYTIRERQLGVVRLLIITKFRISCLCWVCLHFLTL